MAMDWLRLLMPYQPQLPRPDSTARDPQQKRRDTTARDPIPEKAGGIIRDPQQERPDSTARDPKAEKLHSDVKDAKTKIGNGKLWRLTEGDIGDAYASWFPGDRIADGVDNARRAGALESLYYPATPMTTKAMAKLVKADQGRQIDDDAFFNDALGWYQPTQQIIGLNPHVIAANAQDAGRGIPDEIDAVRAHEATHAMTYAVDPTGHEPHLSVGEDLANMVDPISWVLSHPDSETARDIQSQATSFDPWWRAVTDILSRMGPSTGPQPNRRDWALKETPAYASELKRVGYPDNEYIDQAMNTLYKNVARKAQPDFIKMLLRGGAP